MTSRYGQLNEGRMAAVALLVRSLRNKSGNMFREAYSRFGSESLGRVPDWAQRLTEEDVRQAVTIRFVEGTGPFTFEIPARRALWRDGRSSVEWREYMPNGSPVESAPAYTLHFPTLADADAGRERVFPGLTPQEREARERERDEDEAAIAAAVRALIDAAAVRALIEPAEPEPPPPPKTKRKYLL